MPRAHAKGVLGVLGHHERAISSLYSKVIWFFEMEPFLTFIFVIAKNDRSSCSKKHEKVDIVN